MILPAPLDREERSEARRRFGVGDDSFVVVYLAHFRAGKGHDRLPLLAKELLKKVPDARILVAGDTESTRNYRRNAAAFREAVAGLGLGNKVHTLGLVPGSRPLFAAADASLSLSDVEGMSNAQMEAMALGIPVVATDAGGAGELIESGKDGWVVPRGGVEEAVGRLVDLAAAPDLCRRIGEAARNRIASGFSAKQMAERYADLYEELHER
jgi:glycosyltransferase involved in cell wall biosynthesis